MDLKDEDNWKETRYTLIDKHNIKIEVRKNDSKRNGLSEWHDFVIINDKDTPWAFAGYVFKIMDNGGDGKVGESIIIRQPLDY